LVKYFHSGRAALGAMTRPAIVHFPRAAESNMPVVEIVGPAPSTYTRVARMVCEEKQIPYELKQSLPHSPDVDAIHPFGKVPVMLTAISNCASRKRSRLTSISAFQAQD
jgi:hypothetical protein